MTQHMISLRIASGMACPTCSCGWVGKYLRRDRAEAAGEQHASASGRVPSCGKKLFKIKAHADAVLVDAKIAAILHGSKRRREQRSYWCRTCEGWHLTSQEKRRFDEAA